MKILVVSQYFYPENFRINELCFKLKEKGHDITVLTGLPNYPKGNIYDGYKEKDNTYEYIKGVKVFRIKLRPRKKGALNLFRNYISFAYQGRKKINTLDDDFDVVFVYEVSPVTQIIPALKYKKKYNIPVIINCLDIWPEVIKVYGIKENSLIFKATKKLSSHLYRSGDLTITSSPMFNEYLQSVCRVSMDKIIYQPTFAEDYFLTFSDCSTEQSLKHLLFAGNIGKAQNLLCLVNAIKLLPESYKEKIIIDIVGEGSYLETLKEEVNNLKLQDYFLFHGLKTENELKIYYERASAYIIMLEGDSPVSFTIPAKLQGYMGAGKPILGAIGGGAKEIIEISKSGRCVEPDDYKGYANLVIDFIDNTDKYEIMGRNGREYFKEKFTVNGYITKLIKIMEDLKYE